MFYLNPFTIVGEQLTTPSLQDTPPQEGNKESTTPPFLFHPSSLILHP
jgi:hypothetical protein